MFFFLSFLSPPIPHPHSPPHLGFFSCVGGWGGGGALFLLACFLFGWLVVLDNVNLYSMVNTDLLVMTGAGGDPCAHHDSDRGGGWTPGAGI